MGNRIKILEERVWAMGGNKWDHHWLQNLTMIFLSMLMHCDGQERPVFSQARNNPTSSSCKKLFVTDRQELEHFSWIPPTHFSSAAQPPHFLKTVTPFVKKYCLSNVNQYLFFFWIITIDQGKKNLFSQLTVLDFNVNP